VDRAFADQWFDEPIRLIGAATYGVIAPVSEQLNTVEFTPSASCVITAGITGWMTSNDFWLTDTGWSQVSHDWQHTPDPIVDCSQIFSQTVEHHQNRAFCALAAAALTGLIGGIPSALLSAIATAVNDPTDVSHNPVSITGHQDGSALYSWSWEKSGTCSVLLSQRFQSFYY